MSRDNFLSTLSNDSLEVLQHFGPEAPAVLNTYACNVEDALLEALQQKRNLEVQLSETRAHLASVMAELSGAAAQRDQMFEILSDPDQLIRYVQRFFGAEGPCPGGAVISRCRTASAQR